MKSNNLFEEGVASVAREHGIDPCLLIKISQTKILPTRKLERKERNRLYDELPENRKEQIKKFIMEIISDDKEKSYVVNAKHNGVKGEFTYTPKRDLLTEDEDQRLRNIQSRNHRLWTRKMWLGF